MKKYWLLLICAIFLIQAGVTLALAWKAGFRNGVQECREWANIERIISK